MKPWLAWWREGVKTERQRVSERERKNVPEKIRKTEREEMFPNKSQSKVVVTGWRQMV